MVLLRTTRKNFARHESGVRHTTRNLGAKVKAPAFGGDDPAPPVRGPSPGRTECEPRGRGGPRLAGPIHLLAPPALGEGPHCGLARRCIAMCWHAIFVLPEDQGPHPRRSHRRRMYEDAADDSAGSVQNEPRRPLEVRAEQITWEAGSSQRAGLPTCRSNIALVSHVPAGLAHATAQANWGKPARHGEAHSPAGELLLRP